MPVLTFDEILKQIDNKQFAPIYYLFGEETYFIDEITNRLTNSILPEAEREFNQSILYGADIQLSDVIMAARRFPMMAEKQVVVVKEAHEVKGINGLGDLNGKDNLLSLYVENPMDSTVLIINYRTRKLDKRLKFYKLLLKNAVIFESKKLYERDLNAWINKYVNSKGFSIVDNAVQLMGTYLGNDLEKLVNELNKLSVILPSKTTITATHIEENVGISKDYNVFELWDALATKNIAKANQIAFYFSKNTRDHNLIVTISVLFDNFIKLLTLHNLLDKHVDQKNASMQLHLNYFQMKTMQIALRNYPKVKIVKIVSVLRQYDAASKGVDVGNNDTGELTRELISTLLYI